MTRQKFLSCIFFVGLIFLLSGCSFFRTNTTTQITTQTSEDVVTENDLTIRLRAIYELAVSQAGYEGTYEEWLESIRGSQGFPGQDGAQVELRVSSGYLQWKYNNTSIWSNLVQLSSLTGDKGDDGREIVLQVSEGAIKWKYIGDVQWTTLILLETLMGTNGKETELQVASGYIQWRYTDETQWRNLIEISSLTGEKAKEVSFQVVEGFLSYHYEGDDDWISLIEIASLVGQRGDTGDSGADGKEIEIRTIGSELQWRYVGSDDWFLLFDLVFSSSEYTVVFDLQGGNFLWEHPQQLIVPKGDSINLPIPVNEGYVFQGWFTGDTVNDIQFNNYIPITKDTYLYAKWGIDYSLIEEFFALTSDSFYTNYWMTIHVTNGEVFYTFDLQEVFYQGYDLDYIYTYLYKSLSFDLPIYGLGGNTSEYYTVIYPENKQIIIEPTNINLWRFSSFSDVYIQRYDLSFMNPQMFDKQSGFLYYTYRGETDMFTADFTETLSSLGLTFTGMITYSIKDCELDLHNNRLVYYAVGTSNVPTLGNSQIVISIVYDFNEFDEETMTLPFSDFKESVEDEIQFIVSTVYQSDDFEYIIEESLNEFNALVFDKLLILESIMNIGDLTAFYFSDLNLIRYYGFEYDLIGQLKTEMKTSMNAFYLSMINLATSQSIIQMYDLMLVYHDYVDEMSEEDVLEGMLELLYNDYTIELDELYEINYAKYAFHAYKYKLSSQLYMFVIYSGGTFVNYQDSDAYNNLIHYHMAQVESSTTYIDADVRYELAIQEILNTDYERTFYPGFFEDNSYQFWVFIEMYSIFSLNGSDYLTFMNQEDPLLYLITNYEQWTLTAIDFYNLIQMYLVNEWLPFKTNELELYIADLSEIITPDNLILLEAYYYDFVYFLSLVKDIDTFNYLVNIFYDYCDRIPLDLWVQAKFLNQTIINEEYGYLLLTATNDSILLLEEAYNDFVDEFNELVRDDYLGLETLINQTLQMFALVYETAPEHVELFEAKIYYKLLWDEFYAVGQSYFDIEIQSLETPEQLYNSVKHDILYSTNSHDAEQFYLQGRYLFSYNTSLIYLPFDDYIFDLIDEMFIYIDDWRLDYQGSSVNTDLYFEMFYYDILCASSPYNAYDYYLIYLDIIAFGMFEDMYYHFSYWITDIKEVMLSYVDPAYLDELLTLYDQTMDLLLTANNYADFADLYDNYLYQISLFPTT